MSSFHYEAISSSGERSNGVLEASDRGEVMRLLARRGLQPFAIHDAVEMTDRKTSSDKNKGKSEKAVRTAKATGIKLSRAQVIQFTEELCDLLGAGLQLEQALHAMENRSAASSRDTASSLRARVRDGMPFSTALAQVSPSFGELYCNLVSAGEASGALAPILQRQVRYLNQMEALRSKVTGALIYPAFIVFSGVALAIVFVTYLLPKLAVLVKNTQGKLPPVAQWMLAASDVFRGWWWLLLMLVVLAAVTIRVLLQDKARLLCWHRIKLTLPIYGPVLRSRFEVQFLETLGNLLVNGLPLNRALELVKRATMNLFLRDRLSAVEAMVGDGGSLSRALEKTEVARPLVVDMIKVGEQTGEMAETLQKAATRFDNQLSKLIDRAASLIQPVIVLVMAVGVGIMAWMMVSVVYGTMENLRHR
ncbi:type II secretion system F family protein [Phragmitibacter flavus]|uniref:Type II secretion system F family protein n=1 Tax=Phragmitibacter flavus TaxID=2576071 RepID=A0A5R8KGD4_9BACT|nr:type II secretion system F family protein [Phragmitibacter flavus]TLD71291.1 type II secretion system F family protein [Phragmitibacter flavus]